MKKLITVGVILLFLGSSTSALAYSDEKSLIPSSSGNTLYVGGSGPGNYTKIQDAINVSSDGDTVFVYNYSSPYFEHLVIAKEINLVGQNTLTTIINGCENYSVILVKASNVTITNFTLQNGEFCVTNPWYPTQGGRNNVFTRLKLEPIMWGMGIFLHGIVVDNEIAYCFVGNSSEGIHLGAVDDIIKKGDKIHDNTIFNNSMGICQTGPGSDPCFIYNNTIISNGDGVLFFSPNHVFTNNTVTKNQCGVYLTNIAEQGVMGGRNIIIRNNNFSENKVALSIQEENNLVTGNLFRQNDKGLILSSNVDDGCSAKNNFVQGNIFIKNKLGIYLGPSSYDYCIKILKVVNNTIYINNFIKNRVQALCCDKNKWENNYWDDWMGIHVDACSAFPKLIFGYFHPLLWLCNKFELPDICNLLYLPRISCDWHPAKEPYNIPTKN